MTSHQTSASPSGTPQQPTPTSIHLAGGSNSLLLPEGWPSPQGYTNGIVARGRLLFIAGQIGWDPMTFTFQSDDFVDQVAQTLRNIVAVLTAGGATAQAPCSTDLVPSRDKATYLALAEKVRQGGIVRLLVPLPSHVWRSSWSTLMEDAAKVEIEATAVIPDE